MAVIIGTNRSQADSVIYREDEALQERSSAQKQDATVKETPAYCVEVSGNYDDKDIENIADHFKKMIGDFRSGNLSKIDSGDNSKESMDNFKKEFQDNVTKFASTIDSGALKVCPSVTSLWKADRTIVIDFNQIENFFRRGGLNPLRPEAQAALDKYYNAGKYINQGGKDTFLQYNLKFAAITAYENDKLSDRIAKQQITAGQYTSEEYSTAKNYAKILQAKAGVFVTADFVCDGYARQFATGITYSYNGLVCDVGTEELNFMAHHDEAQSVWVKAAQGEYKNKDEIAQALREGGYKDVADQFAVKCTGEMNTEVGAFSENFMHGNAGRTDDYQHLYQKLFGDTEIKPRYSAQQLDAAYYWEGKQGSDDFAKYPLDRDPMILYIDEYGHATNVTYANKKEKDTSSSENSTPSQRISSLKSEISELRKQLEQIKEGSLDARHKQEMIKNINNHMQTIQQQINTITENLAKHY
ncbi:MAG: hypothetical protein H6Q70_3951 [Firmicutes bacterium]|nr:hypothetical protein [Bacillota bacterium]